MVAAEALLGRIHLPFLHALLCSLVDYAKRKVKTTAIWMRPKAEKAMLDSGDWWDCTYMVEHLRDNGRRLWR